MEIVDEEKREIFPNWLVKSLAWAFVAGGVMWVTALQAQFNEMKTTDAKRDKEVNIKISEVQTKVDGNDRRNEVHFQYIRDALNRIEAKLDSEVP